MKYLRAVLLGAMVWALIFVEWSIMVFTPGLKDIGNWQWAIHFVVLAAFVIFAAWIYNKGKEKLHGLSFGVIMLITSIVLDAVISIPLFILPQGTSYAEFFLNPWMLVSYVIFLALAWYFGSHCKHTACQVPVTKVDKE